MNLEQLPTALKRRFVRGRWDVLAFMLVCAFLVYLGEAAHGLAGSLAGLQSSPISLSVSALPGYAARTALRMLLAMGASLLFTFTYATLAARSRRAEVILVPLLDVLQSVPILGFSITILFFLSLTPGRVAGAELAAIFLIFTSQAWNMAFSFYHSLRSIPVELEEAARSLRMRPWLRFWRLDVPFAMPSLIWNMMMSMSGGWFFVVASEAISVGNTTVTLPGVGSYIARAIQERDLTAIGWAIAAMFVVILIFDQLLFRPLIASSDWFRLEQEVGFTRANSWALTMMRRSRLMSLIGRGFERLLQAGMRPATEERTPLPDEAAQRRGDLVWYLSLGLVGLAALVKILHFVLTGVRGPEIAHVAGLALLTFTRITLLIALASLIWVPLGVLIGVRPRIASIVQPLAQLLAAFPANLFFPIVVSGIVLWHLNPDVWLSPLMVLGTQWYILFNVIVGASAIPADLKRVGESLRLSGWLWWRKLALPAVFPFYITGAITASGGSWNASVAAEVASWGQQQLTAHGLGAYIAHATAAGDYRRTVLGIVVMSLFVVLLNRVFWGPLYRQAERRYRLS